MEIKRVISFKNFFKSTLLVIIYRSQYLLVNLHIWITISSCYGRITQSLGLIGRDDGLSTEIKNGKFWDCLCACTNGVVCIRE